jgi:RNA recognition motif-containing protein
MNSVCEHTKSVELLVTNLTARTSEKQVRALFQLFGSVSCARLICDRMTGRSRGLAFVSLNEREGWRHGI